MKHVKKHGQNHLIRSIDQDFLILMNKKTCQLWSSPRLLPPVAVNLWNPLGGTRSLKFAPKSAQKKYVHVYLIAIKNLDHPTCSMDQQIHDLQRPSPSGPQDDFSWTFLGEKIGEFPMRLSPPDFFDAGNHGLKGRTWLRPSASNFSNGRSFPRLGKLKTGPPSRPSNIDGDEHGEMKKPTCETWST